MNEKLLYEASGGYVETNIGRMPIEDYREIYAVQHGFDSYQQMRDSGFRIGNGCDEDAPVLYIDLDGTLAEFKYNPMEELLKQGYFLNLNPIPTVLEGVKTFMRKYPQIPVYILSAFLGESKYAFQEKVLWVEKHLPKIPKEQVLFVKCGEVKALVPGKEENAFLLDDHSQNLIDWEKAGFQGIKLLNGINGKGMKWKGKKISKELSPEHFADTLFILLFEK